MNFKKLLLACLLLLPLALSASVFLNARLGSQQGYLETRMLLSEDLAPARVDGISRSQAGIFLQLDLGENFVLQPEMNWTRKGMVVRVPMYEERWRVDFLELPLLMRFLPFGAKGKAVPSLFVGPYAAARISLAQTVNGQDLGVDLKPMTRNFDLGMIAGAALAVNIDSVRFSIEVRYSRGLSNFLKDPAAMELPAGMKVRTSSLGLLFGYSLPLGKKGN